MIQIEPVISEESLPNPVPLNYVSDLTRISEQLGWQQQIGIDEGLRSLL
jgi:hypothetical protein